MEKPKRIKIKEIKCLDYLWEWDRDIVDISFNDILKKIQQAKNDGWEGMHIVSSYDYVSLNFYKFRLENDKEYETRMKKLEKQRIAENKAKEKRRKEYEKLKKEFGGDS